MALPGMAMLGYHYNDDPSLGATVPHMVGGDPEGADRVFEMHVPEEDGPGYRALVRRSPHGNGYDVLKIL